MLHEHTLCPHCAVNNQPGRVECWHCGVELPIAFGLDGLPKSVQTWTGSHKPTKAEMDALLAQCEAVDVEGDTRRFKKLHEAAHNMMNSEHAETHHHSFREWLHRMTHRHSHHSHQA